ncbi:hypothetical protein P153DRAFT_363780 [Dothidotthia symphoricarpi CBS 119687]|uniref:BTB domain-containing protein n=1 Tax=Dothidotthia symphoricarpi CBS 119687 TaxID=1392245 RepID=A0A6A6AP95_9PLEO|nr:uncharacterized protein P153DRAFT_363780 [Dothidotthia symphoricarpi CBS 119687]KAF2133620.1 hypothetical protein P153DRAFT_363780 [Dothidotthia symphoricarpi CBS 119687]
MALTSADQKPARRPVPRIVPAIPHRLSRTIPSARPITPEESNKGVAAAPPEQQAPEPQAVVEKQVEAPSAAVQIPLTPDSRTSAADKSEEEAPVLASSPPNSQDDHVETRDDTQASSANGQTNVTKDAPSPPTSRAQAKPVTNGVHSKPAIPTQLPPPFYPSTTPTVEDNDAAHTQYHDQPNKDGIMFGAVQGTPTASATPHEMESGAQQSMPRPPPGFAPPQFTPTFFPGHSHHPSEAASSWLHPPYPMAPPDPAYGNGHGGDFQSPSFSAGPNAFPHLHQDHFPLEGTPFAINGNTAHSQSPSKSQFGEARISSEYEEHHAVPYQNGVSARTERLEESPFELASYLSTQFGNPEFADFILQIRSPESMLISIPVHGIVVARSPVISEAIRRSVPPSHRSRDTRRLLDVSTSDPLITRESLEEAIRVLYGAPFLSDQTFLYGLGPYIPEGDYASSSDDARRRMGQLLSYIAAGHVLQMLSMQARGVEIAKSLLRWDTLDQVLHFGLQRARPTVRSGAVGPEVRDPFATILLNHAIDFMAYNFPVDFNLYTIAPELRDDPRLPSLLDARTPSHNPRLSKIQFGDAPPELDATPAHASQMLSTVLLSLPLPLLERIFNHRATANQIGWTGTAKVMRDVIDEREGRRQKALRGQLQPSQDGTIPGALLDNLYLEEHVERVEASPLYPSGYRLSAMRPVGQV